MKKAPACARAKSFNTAMRTVGNLKVALHYSSCYVFLCYNVKI